MLLPRRLLVPQVPSVISKDHSRVPLAPYSCFRYAVRLLSAALLSHGLDLSREILAETAETGSHVRIIILWMLDSGTWRTMADALRRPRTGS